ncbi:hypothetical protein JTE90_008232 [Oedothorax gibbosus]|uniref:[histone H3]-dimethyl-L-lysine(9) demethylase n=1 Tax=Oedothorax gibbosus TaxID=931172 RepID=A0AAV6UMG9_9ARAC|nr:hypothetical protein JTE90_008232 [Oedothorax gibbosus]
MANSGEEDDYLDELERSEDSSDGGDSEGSTYNAKKTKSRRSKSKNKTSKKKSSKSAKGKKPKSKKKKTKEESFSDDSLSQMSDVYPPSVKTRRTRRKRTSSTSSYVDSDGRKTKSEPILITLDSESDGDEQSTTSSRPNRSARIQGEIVRKYGSSMSHKYSASSGLVSKMKKRLSSQLNKKTHHLKLKKHALIGASKKRRLKIRSIHGRIARKGLGRLPKYREPSKSKVNKNDEDELSDPPPPVKRKMGRPRKKPLAKDPSDIEDDIRKITNAPKPAAIKKVIKSAEAQNAESDEEKSPFEDDMDESNSPKVGTRNEDALNEIESDLEKIKNGSVKEELDDSDKERRKKSHKKSHKKKITNQTTTNAVKRRGRPRLSEIKKSIDSDASPVDAMSLMNIKVQVPFLQNSFCFDVAPKLSKCRECRIAVYRNSKRMYNSYCRFMEYRKLCLTKQGLIQSAGFSNPDDATEEHLSQWLPNPKDPPKELNFETAKSLLEHCGDQFCDLIEQEREAVSHHIGLRQKMTWKRIVQGVREMCDVCSTTIFNIHWVCPICGFAVCIDCYKVRKQGIIPEDDEDEDRPKDRDEFKWLLCTQRFPHSQDSLIMAQMIPGKALWVMRDLLHKARKQWKIPSYCKCSGNKTAASSKKPSTGINKQLMSFVTTSFLTEKNHSFSVEKSSTKNYSNYEDLDVEVSGSALRWLNGTCINSDNINNNLKLSDDNIFNYEDFNILGDNLLQGVQENFTEPDFSSYSLDDIISCVTNNHKEDGDKNVMKNFNHRYPQPVSGRDPLPIRIYTKIESELAFPDVPHSWFCNGRLLFLHKANHKDNLSLFQEQWKRGQPIVVQGVDEGLDMDLWRPEGFCRDFGEVKNDLVDCKTGAILKNMPMKKFWEGFENFNKRLTDDDGEYMLLKLKDWPPGEDFSEKLPTRFEDLMKGLPLPEYTHRNGILNLAGRLPSSFVRPDLGPKMYNAYGSALFPQKGTTNLHLDISDAVNVMVYVGIPSDGKSEVHIHEALKAIDEGGCDSLMRFRVRNRNAKPGALWHIYNARDADKIRDMLTKVAIERGEKLEAQHDPIHDQSWYIDAELRLRLYRDYGVEGYAIAQCLGDAVFIPAGAPHQVRNLHSCVKVAEDFVSPENIGHCFSLTQEFRNLSDTHTNHEDKLQIKNIIYHVVRDSLSYMLPPDEPISEK